MTRACYKSASWPSFSHGRRFNPGSPLTRPKAKLQVGALFRASICTAFIRLCREKRVIGLGDVSASCHVSRLKLLTARLGTNKDQLLWKLALSRIVKKLLRSSNHQQV